MPDFRYTAQGPEGRQFSGVLQAIDRSQAAAQLRAQKYMILSLEQGQPDQDVSEQAPRSRMLPRWVPVIAKDRITLLRQLRVMLHSGLPLHSALKNLEKECVKPRLRLMLEEVIYNIQKGKTFSESLGMHKVGFSPMAIGIIASAEESGELPGALERIAKMMEFRKKLIGQTITALVYPTVVFIFALIATAYLVFVFVPDLNDKLLSKMGKPLPAITQLLVDFSHFFTDQWLILSSIMIVFVTTMILMFRNDSGRRKQERFFVAIPVLGTAVKYAMVTQFAGTMAVMLRSGITVLSGVDSVSKITPVYIYKDVFDSASKKILSGMTLRDSLFSNLFPPTVFSVISAGESSGTLHDSFDELERFYSDELESLLLLITSMLSPAILLAVGFIVGIVYIAMFLALISYI